MIYSRHESLRDTNNYIFNLHSYVFCSFQTMIKIISGNNISLDDNVVLNLVSILIPGEYQFKMFEFWRRKKFTQSHILIKNLRTQVCDYTRLNQITILFQILPAASILDEATCIVKICSFPNF